MAQINPNPHTRGYTYIPTLRVTALLDTHEQLRQTLRALRIAGIPGEDTDVFTGTEGALALDLSGEHHGVAVRLWRQLEFMFSDQTALHEQTDAHLKNGGILIAVRVGDEEQRKATVVDILKEQQAHGINYWDSWTVDQFD